MVFLQQCHIISTNTVFFLGKTSGCTDPVVMRDTTRLFIVETRDIVFPSSDRSLTGQNGWSVHCSSTPKFVPTSLERKERRALVVKTDQAMK